MDSGIEFDLLFGPAYKGIPIATTTAVALAEHHDKDLPYCFNRKEAKTHGEGGNLVGSALEGRVMLVDDVITAGTAIRESMEIIQANGATLAGVLISLDRQERGRGEISAIQEVERDYGCKVISIITLKDLIAYLEEKPEMAEHLAAVTGVSRSVRRIELPDGAALIQPTHRRVRRQNRRGRHPTTVLLQLSGNQRPADVEIIRWAVFKFAADKP